GNYDEWNKRYIFFSGGTGDNQYQLDQLRNVNQYIIDNSIASKPIGGSYKHFYKTINPKSNFGPYTAAEVQKTIDQGAVAISYLGHSGTRTWDNSITEPVQLNNKVNRHPLITDFGCSTARFAEPDVISFSQLFVTGIGGQAIAYIGNSSLGFLSTTLAFPQIFYKKILTDSVGILGEAHRLAKLELVKNYGNSGVYQLFTFTNTLIGDPVIKLPLPPKPNLSVSVADLSYSPEIPSDDSDSLKLTISYRNSGKAVAGKFFVQINDQYLNAGNAAIMLERPIPLNSDTFIVNIPIKNRPGTHDITITLDPLNLAEELREDDNTIHMSLEVASASIKSTLLYNKENSVANSIILLNPAVRQSSSKIQYEYDTRNDFRSFRAISADMGNFFTKISMPDLLKDQRYWFRLNQGNGSYSIPGSFWTDNTVKYHLSDSVSYANVQLNSIKNGHGRLYIDTAAVNFSILSAGYLDGRTVSVQNNGQELVPEVTLRGHHVCIVEDSTFKFVKYILYDVMANANATTEYSAMLDTLSSKYMIMVGVMDEGTVNSAALRNKLKSYGSRYIDSLGYRGSWAFIGKRGAAPGSVPEAFSRAGKGSVRVDTTFYMPRKTGVLLTGRIGPVSKWASLKVNQDLPEKAQITYIPLAISASGTTDTLGNVQLLDGVADLSSIDAGKYPYLQLLADFNANPGGESPILKSLGVNYTGVPELGLNYQIVSVARDTIKQGELDTLKFFVANAGESRADSIRVLIDLLRPDNKTRTLLDTLITSVDSMSLAAVTYNYLSNIHDTHGNMAFIIRIDPENRIREIFEDNNSFKIPFFVKQDTTPVSISDATLKVTYDGQEILDGDYVSPSPEIRMSLNYPVWFPYSDTTALSIMMDRERLNFSSMTYSFDTIKRKAEYIYIPKLSAGEHTLEVSGNNIYGNLETGKGYRMTFTVTDQAKVMDVYNYPNPAAGSTNFTFRLSRIPEDLRIKVYTVAGRLVREIKQNPALLSANFNHIPFDCKDQDGNNLANGVYLYKIIVKDSEHAQEVIQKMAIVR
ncbi:MAG: C25 family cysteine peptidase, partial [Bacteroidota bacterium]